MIVTICQQKGGTGKSTTALNLSACLGEGTLLVDLDPQGACAISLGINPDELDVTVYDALTERADVTQAIIPTSYGFDLLPANIDLAAAEVELTSMPGRDYALRRALKPVLDTYQHVVIDTPPTLGLLTINALATSDTVLIPTSTQLLTLRGLDTLLDTIERIRRYEINPDLAIAGILPTKFDRRTVHARQVLEYLISFGESHRITIYEPIPSTVRFDEATNEHTPFVVRFPDHSATQAYKEVARELTTQGS